MGTPSRYVAAFIMVAVVVLSLLGCERVPPDPIPDSEPKTNLEKLHAHVRELKAKPEHGARKVKVQHILIAFKGSGASKPVKRSKEKAEELAANVFARALDGEDFGKLVEKYTGDSAPGIYTMTAGSPSSMDRGARPRSGMVNAFGDVGWRLGRGEIGVAAYHEKDSPFGWHIIKRLS